MKKENILILFFLTIVACGKLLHNEKSNSKLRTEILNREFSSTDFQSIEIIEIEHPMLGGIIEKIKLNDSQKERFLNDFDRLEPKGMLKCGAQYIIRLNMKMDTLRLKVCSGMIANRKNDFYYKLENGENIIEKYITTD